MNKQDTTFGTGTKEMELLTILVDDQLFGVNVDKVQSIVMYDPELVTSLPGTQSGISGMLLYRNRTIPLLDLSQILDIDIKQKFDKEIIVVTEFNKTINSFKAQGVNRIYRLPWKEFIPLDHLFEDNSFFTGSVNVDDTQVLILDLEHILAEFFPETLIEQISQENLDQATFVQRENLEIVFAEDSPTMRKAVVKQLQTAGFQNIKPFVNGGQALDHLIQKYKNNSDRNIKNVVLISDIDMPVLDGLTLCHQVKTDPDLKDIYVVMFSSLINEQMITKCNKINADFCINKPEINRLINILDKRC
ncbi:chemotaxis protein CheV [Desulfobacula toluolica]|uniref:Predicted CheW-like chemotaxis response regulatory protein n=1 Tax=Desulfobacula toluolica (strain DSM 7467 / Tol2) TaxID=651182 RepID=K0NNJ6_DESTT|nr:chemotaxis protein [Desulfobacula toluolica]CCK80337.1 predicted CheW-like chemotaxis response regulatory protein [Desulfobacula toluolica Tol2]